MADEQGAIPEALGPLWRKVQQVQVDAMRNDWSVVDYRAGMAATLGISTSDSSAVSGSAEGLREAVEALKPFASYADPRKAMPASMPVTQGSGMARRQITMGDCYAASNALAALTGGHGS